MFDIYLLRCRPPLKVAELFEKDVQYGKKRVHSGRAGEPIRMKHSLVKDVTFVM
jgi:hypothetical protein